MYKSAVIAAALVAKASADQTSYLDNAGCANDQLLRWYNQDTGLFNENDGSTSYWWQSANMISTVAALASLDDGVKSNVASMWDNTYNKGGQQSHAKREQGFVGGYFDDEGWWAVAWLDLEDLTGTIDYLNEAIDIWNDMKASWGSQICNCLPWERGEPSSNSPQAISNDLFFLISASIANRVGGDVKDTYVQQAKDVWSWFQDVQLLDPQGLVSNNIDNTTCKNANNTAVYSYNQGVVIGGLAELATATGDTSYLDAAESIADAATTQMVDSNGVFKDDCDPNHNCDGDGTQFKGIFMRNLAKLYKQRQKDEWKTFTETTAQAIWQNDLSNTDGNCLLGPEYAGPYRDADASSQSSALDALNAAVAMNS